MQGKSSSFLWYLVPIGALQLIILLGVFRWQNSIRISGMDSPALSQVSHKPQSQLRRVKLGVFNVTSLFGNLPLRPINFDISELPFPYETDEPQFNEFVRNMVKRKKMFKSIEDIATQLCVSAFGMDVAALRYFLYDVGISPNLRTGQDSNRTPLLCLSQVQLFADANSRGQYIPFLENQTTWLTKVYDPSLPTHTHLPAARDIIDALEKPVRNCAKWLFKAGADPNLLDDGGASPLHHASYGGLFGLVQLLLEHKADPTIKNEDLRTPMHYALSKGHALVAYYLYKAGGDLYVRDRYRVRPIDMIENPGPISAAEALEYFNVVQRPVRNIDRIIHPELHPDDKLRGWRHGSGGWNTKRLDIAKEDMHCDVDQYYGHEITGDEIFEKYIARNAPVLIRGLLNDWPMADVSSVAKLKLHYGRVKVLVSNVPYAEKFGGDAAHMTLAEYIDKIVAGQVPGGERPWYLFRGHGVPYASESDDSLVSLDICPTPDKLYEALSRMPRLDREEADTPKERRNDVNLEWGLGIEGSGSPVHFHNVAWFLYSPHDMIMSNMPIMEFYHEHMERLNQEGFKVSTCVQTAGDIMIVPECWGHGIMNIQQSVAVAFENINDIWRTRQRAEVLQYVPRNKQAVIHFMDKKKKKTDKAEEEEEEDDDEKNAEEI